MKVYIKIKSSDTEAIEYFKECLADFISDFNSTVSTEDDEEGVEIIYDNSGKK